jgi:molybdopterin-guanine dinucleotide biosynthesis protein A
MSAVLSESVNLADYQINNQLSDTLFQLKSGSTNPSPTADKMSLKQVTGIVLAGGRSSRMGENKSLLKLGGKTMIEFSIGAVSPLCREVVISSDSPDYGFTGCTVWPDEIRQQAPMIGIYSCLNRSETDINIFLTCDMPLISTALLEYLLTCSSDSDITVPVHDNGMIEPLCGIYRKSAAGILKMCIDEGNYSMHGCIRRANHRLVTVDDRLPFFSGDFFQNINTPADFEDISARLFPGGGL